MNRYLDERCAPLASPSRPGVIVHYARQRAVNAPEPISPVWSADALLAALGPRLQSVNGAKLVTLRLRHGEMLMTEEAEA